MVLDLKNKDEENFKYNVLQYNSYAANLGMELDLVYAKMNEALFEYQKFTSVDQSILDKTDKLIKDHGKYYLEDKQLAEEAVKQIPGIRKSTVITICCIVVFTALIATITIFFRHFKI